MAFLEKSMDKTRSKITHFIQKFKNANSALRISAKNFGFFGQSIGRMTLKFLSF